MCSHTKKTSKISQNVYKMLTLWNSKVYENWKTSLVINSNKSKKFKPYFHNRRNFYAILTGKTRLLQLLQNMLYDRYLISSAVILCSFSKTILLYFNLIHILALLNNAVQENVFISCSTDVPSLIFTHFSKFKPVYF